MTIAKEHRMKVFFNYELPANEQAWEACNGTVRRKLMIINNLGREIPSREPVDCQLAFLNKGNHSFIFINPGRPGDDRIKGVFMDKGYGLRVHEGKEIFSACSTGGPKNSESTFGIYEAGTILALDSYDSRQGESFTKLDPVKGWIDGSLAEIFADDVIEV